jgi:hypothetical protein
MKVVPSSLSVVLFGMVWRQIVIRNMAGLSSSPNGPGTL